MKLADIKTKTPRAKKSMPMAYKVDEKAQVLNLAIPLNFPAEYLHEANTENATPLVTAIPLDPHTVGACYVNATLTEMNEESGAVESKVVRFRVGGINLTLVG